MKHQATNCECLACDVMRLQIPRDLVNAAKKAASKQQEEISNS